MWFKETSHRLCRLTRVLPLIIIVFITSGNRRFKVVKNQAEEIRSYLLAKIPVHSKNIVAKAATAFACSRTTVHRHLNRLLRDGKIIKSGTTRQVQYFLKTEKNKKIQMVFCYKYRKHKIIYCSRTYYESWRYSWWWLL